MQELNLPSYPFKVKRDADILQIFDIIRKKWVVLQPEEWVRQHVVWYLTEEKGYPASLIAVEKSLLVNKLQKRFDIVLHNNLGKPLIIVECKAPEIQIGEDALHQALRYNSIIQAPYILITNGLDMYCGKINFTDASFSYLKDIPFYKEIK
jgi:hypothetical protein